MAINGPVRIRPSVPPTREQAAQLLTLIWSDLWRVGDSLQRLDQPIVRHAEWGDLYAEVQGTLDAMLELVGNTISSPYPAEASRLKDLGDDLTVWLSAAKYAVRDFNWDRATGCLYACGVHLYRVALMMGVEL